MLRENEEALQKVVDNIAAIQGSADAADRADAAAESAAGDAERAEAAARLAQTIAQGQKGYYATPEALKAAFPSGEDGDWAIIGTTDTIWIWDADDGAWEDSGNKTDLSHYYTREETDAEIDELQAALGKQIAAATSHTWTVEVPASAWTAGTYTATYGGVSFTCTQKATINTAGMAADTVLGLPEFAGGDLTAAQTWAVAVPGANTVTFWSETKPAANFTVRLVEVK